MYSVLNPEALCLSTAGACPNPRWLDPLLRPGLPTYYGFDTDATGEAMAQEMIHRHPLTPRAPRRERRPTRPSQTGSFKYLARHQYPRPLPNPVLLGKPSGTSRLSENRLLGNPQGLLGKKNLPQAHSTNWLPFPEHKRLLLLSADAVAKRGQFSGGTA